MRSDWQGGASPERRGGVPGEVQLVFLFVWSAIAINLHSLKPRAGLSVVVFLSIFPPQPINEVIAQSDVGKRDSILMT